MNSKSDDYYLQIEKRQKKQPSPTPVQHHSSYRQLASALHRYGKAFHLNRQDLSTAFEQAKRNSFVDALNATSYTSMSQLDSINEHYSWLTFKNKRYEMAAKAWALADSLYPNGKDVIAHAGKVVGTSYAKEAGLDGDYFNGFVNEMLQRQFAKLKVVSTSTTASTSEEFERWKKSAYTAGIVKTDGSLQFLVYGEIRNDSKFDFPVAMRVCSKVCQVQKIESGGMLGGLINVLGALANAPTQNVETLGTITSKEFLIPCALSGQTMPYAILIELEDTVLHATNGGVNLMDLLKVSSQIVLDNPTVKMEISDKDPTRQQLAEQSAWLKMAVNGLPETKTIDLFRNQEYKQSTWDAEWERILRYSAFHSYSSSRRIYDNWDYYDEYDEDWEDLRHPTVMYTCRVRLLHKDGRPISASTIHAEWDEGGGWFQNHGKGEFKVDNKGYAVISWPKEEGDRVNYISFNESILPNWERLENLELRNGNFYRLNVDALKNK